MSRRRDRRWPSSDRRRLRRSRRPRRPSPPNRVGPRPPTRGRVRGGRPPRRPAAARAVRRASASSSFAFAPPSRAPSPSPAAVAAVSVSPAVATERDVFPSAPASRISSPGLSTPSSPASAPVGPVGTDAGIFATSAMLSIRAELERKIDPGRRLDIRPRRCQRDSRRVTCWLRIVASDPRKFSAPALRKR